MTEPGWERTSTGANRRGALEALGRRATADVRLDPRFVIIGAQRAGTTSLYTWLCSHRHVEATRLGEMHYFDRNYDKGRRWYRSQYPLARRGRVSGETSPYLLFHPAAPERVARDLPASTVFIALLRDPVQRALSHYWHERRMGTETEPLATALELEPSRLAADGAEMAHGADGDPGYAHRHFSYVARGEYAPQLQRWFEHVGRDRVVVVESERLFRDRAASAAVLDRLGLEPMDVPLPALNAATRADADTDAVVAALARRFASSNEELFELLGRRLWEHGDRP